MATSCGDGRNVVTKGVMVNVLSAARLDIVGSCMEKPWLQVVVAAKATQMMRRTLEEAIIVMVVIDAGALMNKIASRCGDKE